MNYRVLASASVISLEKLVETYMVNKWKPQGGLVILTSSTGNNLFYQAMVKE